MGEFVPTPLRFDSGRGIRNASMRVLEKCDYQREGWLRRSAMKDGKLVDEALYAKLRSHPWDPVVEWTGNRGRHYGTIQPAYVRAYLLPLLSRSAQ